MYIEGEEVGLISELGVVVKNGLKDLEMYLGREDGEKERYVSNDRDGKYFEEVGDDDLIGGLDY